MAPTAQVFLWSNATLKPLGGYRPPSRMSRHPHSAGTQSHNTQHSPQHPQPARPQTPEGVSTFPFRIALGKSFLRRILPSPQSLRPTAMRLPPRCNSDRGFIQFSHPHSGPLLPLGRTTTTLTVWTNALMDCPAQVGRPTMLTVCSDWSMDRVSCPLARTADLLPSQQQLAPLQTHGQAKPGRK